MTINHQKQRIQAAVDTSAFIGLVNQYDHWHRHTITLFQSLSSSDIDLVHFDCVIAETLSAVQRRFAEQSRTNKIDRLFEQINTHIPVNEISWILPRVPALYNEILSLMRANQGDLNFNDALIALACREQQISTIISYDSDFDQIPWLKRIAKPEDLSSYTQIT